MPIAICREMWYTILYQTVIERRAIVSLSKKFVKKQLERVAPIARSVSLELMRKGQNHIGSIMSAGVRRRVRIDEISLGGMRCAFAVPDEPRRGGAVLMSTAEAIAVATLPTPRALRLHLPTNAA